MPPAVPTALARSTHEGSDKASKRSCAPVPSCSATVTVHSPSGRSTVLDTPAAPIAFHERSVTAWPPTARTAATSLPLNSTARPLAVGGSPDSPIRATPNTSRAASPNANVTPSELSAPAAGRGSSSAGETITTAAAAGRA